MSRLHSVIGDYHVMDCEDGWFEVYLVNGFSKGEDWLLHSTDSFESAESVALGYNRRDLILASREGGNV